MRVTRDDWVQCGLRTLEDEGHAALSAERLARKLGVTRGSFYHHFPTTDAYTEALLEQWVATHTFAMLAQAADAEPATELSNLIQLTFTLPIELENSIRAWGRVNARVHECVARTEALRIATLGALYRRMTGDPEKAEVFSRIAYYGLVGAAHAVPRLSHDALESLVRRVHDLMMTSL